MKLQGDVICKSWKIHSIELARLLLLSSCTCRIGSSSIINFHFSSCTFCCLQCANPHCSWQSSEATILLRPLEWWIELTKGKRKMSIKDLWAFYLPSHHRSPWANVSEKAKSANICTTTRRDESKLTQKKNFAFKKDSFFVYSGDSLEFNYTQTSCVCIDVWWLLYFSRVRCSAAVL